MKRSLSPVTPLVLLFALLFVNCGGNSSGSNSAASNVALTLDSYRDGLRLDWNSVAPNDYSTAYLLRGGVTSPAEVLANPATQRFDDVHPGIYLTDLENGAAYSAVVIVRKPGAPAATSRVVQATPSQSNAPIPPLDSQGGERASGGVVLDVPAGTIWSQARIRVAATALPAALPAGFVQAATPLGIEADRGDAFNAPLRAKIGYDPAALIGGEENLLVLHWKAATSQYLPVSVLAQDTSLHTIDVELRAFATLVLVGFDPAALPTDFALTDFTPASHGWSIGNLGHSSEAGGNGFGMAAYCAWYWSEPTLAFPLAEQFGPAGGSAGDTNVLATRAHLAQLPYWGALVERGQFGRMDSSVIASMKAALARAQRPLVLVMRDAVTGNKGAGVVYGYNNVEFLFYDVNYPGQVQKLPYAVDSTLGSHFLGYQEFDQFAWLGVPTLGRNLDFNNLTGEALFGFSSSHLLALLTPAEGTVTQLSTVQLLGSVNRQVNAEGAVIAYATGEAQARNLDSSTGRFDEQVAVSPGNNTLVLLAGVTLDGQSNFYRNSVCLVRNFAGQNCGITGAQPIAGMVPIAQGSFAMGSNSIASATNEGPIHQVTLTECFFVSDHEVTQAEYQALMGSNPSQGPAGANAPVERVSWNDARDYCTALTAQESALGNVPLGYEYRLPTEAEWEYVCRAGSSTDFAVGSALYCDQAWFQYSNASDSACGHPGWATIGKSYPGNAWGLYDLHGNVAEWCLDSYTEPYAAGAVSDPLTAGLPDKVIRGGSWQDNSTACRSAYRSARNSNDSAAHVGFRVVLGRVLVP